jgi:two-component system, response regulator PdtaR
VKCACARLDDAEGTSVYAGAEGAFAALQTCDLTRRAPRSIVDGMDANTNTLNTAAPRWRVAVLDDDDRSRASLGDEILSAGGRTTAEATHCDGALALLRETKPDVAIVSAQLPDGDTMAVAAQATATVGCPVVLLGRQASPALMARALEAGVMAFLLKPLRRGQLAPTLDLAVARFQEVRRLRQALEDRKVIDRAKGRLMERERLGEAEAFRRIRTAAMNSRRPMVAVAEEILARDEAQPSRAKAGARSAPSLESLRSKSVYGLTLPSAAVTDSATPGWRRRSSPRSDRISRLMLSFSPHTQPMGTRPHDRT